MPLREPYEALKRLAKSDYRSRATSDQIMRLVNISLTFLNEMCDPVDLISLVPGKQYISYALKTDPLKLSRPINRALFNPDLASIEAAWNSWGAAGSQLVIGSLTYTMAIAYCAASELFDRNNKKGPATYFELLIGHLFARELGVNPTKKVALPVSGRAVRLTMDFLFNPAGGRPHIHLPVKMSTRERVVQAWAHQRLLDAAYGHAAYRAILVVFSETKLNLQNHEVVEICVPDQWLAYQTHLATMDRIYYFDVPTRYANLARDFPIIQLKQFGEFFSERETVLGSPLA